jgi:hypothetical protein
MTLYAFERLYFRSGGRTYLNLPLSTFGAASKELEPGEVKTRLMCVNSKNVFSVFFVNKQSAHIYEIDRKGLEN